MFAIFKEPGNTQPRPQRIFSLQEEGKKTAKIALKGRG